MGGGGGGGDGGAGEGGGGTVGMLAEMAAGGTAVTMAAEVGVEEATTVTKHMCMLKSFTMLKHRPTDRSHTCSPPDVFSDWTHQTVQFGTESNGYRGTGPGEQFGSVNKRSSHHRVVS